MYFEANRPLSRLEVRGERLRLRLRLRLRVRGIVCRLTKPFKWGRNQLTSLINKRLPSRRSWSWLKRQKRYGWMES
jgi:hypothetical protein